MDAPAIETHDLHMHYGQGETEVRALDGVDLVIQAGEMVSIMGPSGSGKSTLLHIVGALESPTSGTVAVAGLHYEGLGDKELTELRRDHIGFVFQFFNLLPCSPPRRT
jgi:putative ABC transport system ATP-binding protein